MTNDNLDPLRVLIVAGDPLARSALAAALEGQPNCQVVGQLSSDDDLPGQLAVFLPDLLLWDLGWNPNLEQAADLERLTDLADNDLPVLALLPDDGYSADIWATGVQGLLLRDAEPPVLAAALHTIAQGLAVLDPSLMPSIPGSSGRDLEPPAEALTPRENQVLQLLADGLSNRAIGFELGISEHTVKFHVNAIMGKLAAQSRTEAVVRATRLGLITL